MTTERRGLPEAPSETGKPITPSSMMKNTTSTSKPSVAIHVHLQSQHPHGQQILNFSHDSIASLRNLSDSLLAFQRCFTETHQLIDSIRATIHSVIPLLTTITPLLPASSPPPALSAAPEPESSWESDPSEEEEEEKEEGGGGGEGGEEEGEGVEEEEEGEEEEEEEGEDEDEDEEEEEEEEEEVQSYHSEEVQSPRGEEVQSPRRLELESICKSKSGLALRRYMLIHILDLNRLLEEVPKALRLSPNPARLVLKCMGKFYLQGSKSYTTSSYMVQVRKVCVLVLECFLLMGIDGYEIEKGVKEEAEKAALAWRKRLIAEGGVQKASEMDARGLLLLIGCFGIPGGLGNEDIRYLLQVSDIKSISGALRKSSVLMAKIPEIIEGLVQQNMEVDAVHIAFTFGIEDRFNPQNLLTSFLLDSEETLKKMKEKSQGSLAAVNEAKKKHLFALTSVIKCLKLHNIDPSKLLPAWKINEKIMALEKEIGGFDKQIDKRMSRKRKKDETKSSRRSKNKKARHSCILQDNTTAGHSYPTCSQCGKNHLGECLRGQDRCFGCGQVGHRLKDCTCQNGTPTAGHSYPTCSQCGKNHLGKCLFGQNRCFRCGQVGHRLNDCPGQNGTPTAGHSFPTCSQCGKNHPGKCLLGQDRCFRCGQVGHKLRDCPGQNGTPTARHSYRTCP